MTGGKTLDLLLKARFSARHVGSALKHFRKMVETFQRNEWEESLAKASKFVEAVLKALYVHAGKSVPRGREFKAGKIMDELGNLPRDTFDDSVRLSIPRACRFIYDIASNRGGRHDSTEIDPNEMDATQLVATCSWVLAEMVRYSQKGALPPDQAKAFVDGLMQRKYPIVEEIDGRVYFHVSNASARDVALLSLWYIHPNRMSKEKLRKTIKRHRFSESNAATAVSRLTGLVDDDGVGNLRLLNPGLKKADRLIGSAKEE